MRGILLFLMAWGWALAQADTVRVAAAADLQYALADIAQAFEAKNPGIKVLLNFGSSGKFYTQITQGLPVDLYFSADEIYPLRLEREGLLVLGTRRPYAVGRLVIWVGKDLVQRGLDPRRLGPRALLDPRVTRLAIANPVHAPYGRAALTLLEHYGLIRKLRDVPFEEMTAGVPAYYDIAPLARGKPSFTFVYGENISHTAQLALTSTKVGILALSIAKNPTLEAEGHYWLAPLESHLRLDQAYGILKGKDRPAVRRFYEFISGPEARRIFKHYGFLLPGEEE